MQTEFHTNDGALLLGRHVQDLNHKNGVGIPEVATRERER